MERKIEIQLFNLYLNHYTNGWGIDVVRISWDMIDATSFLKLYAYKTYKWCIGFDLFFLRGLIDRYRDKLADKMLWNKKQTTWFDRLAYKLLCVGL